MSEKSKNREELLQLDASTARPGMEVVLLLQAVTQRSEMNLTDLQCINILTSTGPIHAGQLAETMGLTTGAVTGVINRMERMGYARREKHSRRRPKGGHTARPRGVGARGSGCLRFV